MPEAANIGGPVRVDRYLRTRARPRPRRTPSGAGAKRKPTEAAQVVSNARKALLRAQEVLKVYDPNQPRDNEGQWTDTGGGGSGVGQGLKAMRWTDLSRQQKLTRAGSLYTSLDSQITAAEGRGDNEVAISLKQRQFDLNQDIKEFERGRPLAMERTVGGWHEARRRGEEAARMTAAGQAQRPDPNQPRPLGSNLRSPEELRRAADVARQRADQLARDAGEELSARPTLAEVREKTASLSGKLATFAETARMVLEAVVPGDDKPGATSTLAQRTMATAAAVASAAVAINSASKSADLPTAAFWLKRAAVNVGSLKTAWSSLSDAAKGAATFATKEFTSPKHAPKYAAAMSAFKSAETTAARAAVRLTGGSLKVSTPFSPKAPTLGQYKTVLDRAMRGKPGVSVKQANAAHAAALRRAITGK